MPQKTYHYSNGEITVTWKSGICIHSGICFKGLAEVFDTHRKPRIDISKAETGQIIEQVKNVRVVPQILFLGKKYKN